MSSKDHPESDSDEGTKRVKAKIYGGAVELACKFQKRLAMLHAGQSLSLAPNLGIGQLNQDQGIMGHALQILTNEVEPPPLCVVQYWSGKCVSKDIVDPRMQMRQDIVHAYLTDKLLDLRDRAGRISA